MPKSGLPVSPQTFDKMLRNPLYAGWITSAWGITVQGLWTPIVSEELFREVDRRLSGNGTTERQTRSQHSNDFPLRVFVRCAACGKGITGSFNTSRNGKRYPNYTCRTPKCRAASFRRDDLHRMFFEVLYGLLPQEEYMPLFRRVLTDVWKQKNHEREQAQGQIDQRITVLKAKRQN